jgi:hypothetical protein
MTGRTAGFQRELIEQSSLIDLPMSHHDLQSCFVAATESANIIPDCVGPYPLCMAARFGNCEPLALDERPEQSWLESPN